MDFQFFSGHPLLYYTYICILYICIRRVFALLVSSVFLVNGKFISLADFIKYLLHEQFLDTPRRLIDKKIHWKEKVLWKILQT